MIVVCVSGIYRYASHDWARFLTLGRINQGKFPSHTYLRDEALPYIYLWLVMLLSCCLVMHVQIILRFMSSMPCLYWFCAFLVQGDVKKDRTTKMTLGTRSGWGRIYVGYTIFYQVVGVMLFTNFYPPAWRKYKISKFNLNSLLPVHISNFRNPPPFDFTSINAFLMLS